MTFALYWDGKRWWARTSSDLHWVVSGTTRAYVEQKCREYVAERTGRPSPETTIFFVDEPPGGDHAVLCEIGAQPGVLESESAALRLNVDEPPPNPQRDALCNIDTRLGALEREVSGLREAVTEALRAHANSPISPLAVARIRGLHRPCTEMPNSDQWCEQCLCDKPVCAHDNQDWPCATIRALVGESDG